MSEASEWAVAAGTLALAGVTGWMAWKTRDVAQATHEAAAASQLEAEASRGMIDEIQHDRDLAWRPILTIQSDSVTVGPGLLRAKTSVTNVGRGPAVNCIHFQAQDGKWCRSLLFSLAPSSTDLITSDTAPHPILGALLSYGQDDVSGTDVVVCQDGPAERLYRFIGGRPGFETWKVGDPAPSWAKAAVQIEPMFDRTVRPG